MLLVWILIMWSEIFEGCNANHIRQCIFCVRKLSELSLILSASIKFVAFWQKIQKCLSWLYFLGYPPVFQASSYLRSCIAKKKSFSIIAEGDTVALPPHRAAQRAKFVKKVHKPPLRVNVINFELNGFNASIWVPQTPKSCDALIEILTFIR